jgi:predicted transcriptional regulator
MASALPLAYADMRRLVTALKSRELRSQDASVYWAVLVHTSPVTRELGVSTLQLAECLGIQRPHVAASLARLVRAGILVRRCQGYAQRAIYLTATNDCDLSQDVPY